MISRELHLYEERNEEDWMTDSSISKREDRIVSIIYCEKRGSLDSYKMNIPDSYKMPSLGIWYDQANPNPNPMSLPGYVDWQPYVDIDI